MGAEALEIFARLLPPKLVDVTIDSVTLTVARELDLKKMDISKRNVPLLREWLRKPDVLAILESLDLDQNEKLCGGVDPETGEVVPDGDVGTFKQVCDALKGTKVKRLCVRNTGMGSESASVLADLIETMPFIVVNASATGSQSGISLGDPETSVKDVMELLQDGFVDREHWYTLAEKLMELPSLIVVFQA